MEYINVQKKSEKFVVSLTPTEKQRIQRAAYLEGVSMSRYMAKAALIQAAVVLKDKGEGK